MLIILLLTPLILDSRITDTQLKVLLAQVAKDPHIKLLNLQSALHRPLSLTHCVDTPITDEGAKHVADILAVNKDIVWVNLGNCAITHAGICALIYALRGNQSITLMDLEGAQAHSSGCL